jgi:hypothetical protein
MKRLFAAALLAAIPLLARATTYSTDATDLWYIPSESGWGVNLAQQEDTLFATLFVYGADGKPTWFVSPAMIPVSSGGLAFAGDLYTTSTGTYFGAPWNPSALGSRKVGTATFTLDTINTGTFTYSVDGTPVVKQVVRQTWKNDDYNGSYWGSLSGTYSGCGSGVDGHSESLLSFSITQAGASIKLQDSTNCTYTGTYSQAGHIGSFTTTGTGSGGCANSFNAVEVEGTLTGLTMRATVTLGNCTLQAGISGVKR